MDVYPENTQASFKVRLPRTLYIKQDYEVGLAEIQYPITYETFAKRGAYRVEIIKRTEAHRVEVLEESGKSYYRKFFLPRGYYATIEELVQAFNAGVTDLLKAEGLVGDEISMKIHPIQQKVELFVEESWAINFSGPCNDVFGLEQKYHGNEMGTHVYDITRGFHSLFVYCSICHDQIVGDVFAPLIRSVGIKGTRGVHTTQTYGDPHYVPVNTDEVNVLEINIKDDTGQDVPFMSGKVVCKLHFRQRTI